MFINLFFLSRVVLATLVFPDILDLMENLWVDYMILWYINHAMHTRALKDREAVMANLEDLDQGYANVY